MTALNVEGKSHGSKLKRSALWALQDIWSYRTQIPVSFRSNILLRFVLFWEQVTRFHVKNPKALLNICNMNKCVFACWQELKPAANLVLSWRVFQWIDSSLNVVWMMKALYIILYCLHFTWKFFFRSFSDFVQSLFNFLLTSLSTWHWNLE